MGTGISSLGSPGKSSPPTWFKGPRFQFRSESKQDVNVSARLHGSSGSFSHDVNSEALTGLVHCYGETLDGRAWVEPRLLQVEELCYFFFWRDSSRWVPPGDKESQERCEERNMENKAKTWVWGKKESDLGEGSHESCTRTGASKVTQRCVHSASETEISCEVSSKDSNSSLDRLLLLSTNSSHGRVLPD